MMRKFLVLLASNLFFLMIADAQWQEVNVGLNGGNITALTVDSSTNYIYAGTSNNGIFLSVDNGSHWIAANRGLSKNPIISMAISGNNIFAGTLGDGVFVSNNNGNSWTRVNIGDSLENGMYVPVIATKGDNIFVGANNGLFVSNDNGATWNISDNGIINNNIMSIAIKDDIMVAGNLYRIFISTDNGSNWIEKSNGLSLNDLDNGPVNSIAFTGSTIIAGTGVGFFISTDNGNNWVLSNNGFTGTDVTSIAVSGNSIFAGTYKDGFFISTNNGSTWTAINSGLTTYGLHTSSIAINRGKVFVGTQEGVFQSTDNGNNWIPINNGLSNTNVISLLKSSNNIFAGTERNGLFLSANGGNSWTPVNTGLTNKNVTSLALNDGKIYAGTFGGGVFLSTNNGNNWTEKNTGLSDLFVTALTINGNNIFAGTDQKGVFVSTNNGDSWVSCQNFDSYPHSLYPYVQSLASSEGIIFEGTKGYGIQKSEDNGNTWSTSIQSGHVYSFVISGTRIFAATSYGVLYSSDNGVNWNRMNNGLPRLLPLSNIPRQVTSIVMNEDKLYCSVYGSVGYYGDPSGYGTFFSNDQGNTWAEMNLGLEFKDIYTLALNDNNIFAGTLGNGCWRYSLSIITDITSTENNKIIIFPNPVKTTLFFSGLSQNSKVSVYDFQGKLIIPALFTGNQIDVSHLINGIYMLRIVTENGIITKRFLKE